MAKKQSVLEAMRSNPRGDWKIGDVEKVCRDAGVDCRKPTKGSHYKVTHSSQEDHVTIPARKPIKSVYITDLVAFIDAVEKRA